MIKTSLRRMSFKARFQVRKVESCGDTWLAELTLLMDDGAQTGAQIRIDESVVEHFQSLCRNYTQAPCKIIVIPYINEDEEKALGFESLLMDNPLPGTPRTLEYELEQ